MRQLCDERKDWSRGYISHNKIEMKGIFHLLHGAPNGDQQSPAHDQVATSLLTPPRWTFPRERTPVVPSSAGPANESKMLIDLKRGSKSWSKRRQNYVLKTVADPINARDDKIDRAVLQRLAITGGASDKENSNKPRGGTSKSAKNKTNKTIQNNLIGLAVVMSSYELALKPTVSKSIADNAAKMQQISVASSASTTCTTDASGTFNRKDDMVSYRKPAKLVKVLLELFNESQPKIDEYQMREKMSKMIDPEDGGLMFCYAKTGTPTLVGMTKGSHAWKDWEGWQACKKKPCACNCYRSTRSRDELGPKQRRGRNARLTKSVTMGSLAMSVTRARGLEN